MKAALLSDEPAPFTVTLPLEPTLEPIKVDTLLTAPPFCTLSAPRPVYPTFRSLPTTSDEPAPSTVTPPLDPKI
ncbi:hypothetical protein ACVWW1_009679 [Bradyrhizobium sp. JR3.5]